MQTIHIKWRYSRTIFEPPFVKYYRNMQNFNKQISQITKYKAAYLSDSLFQV